jgi:hypothetical protein
MIYRESMLPIEARFLRMLKTLLAANPDFTQLSVAEIERIQDAELRKTEKGSHAGGALRPIDLEGFRAGVRGRPYKALIQHHLKKQNDVQRMTGLRGTLSMFPVALHKQVESYADRWKSRAYDKAFWQRDCADVFDEMIRDARSVLESADYP